MSFAIDNLRILAASVLAVTALVAAGCAHYQAGKPADTPFRTVYIEPVSNRSFAPQAQALLSTQVRDHIMRDGRVKVVGPEHADAILTIMIEDYERDATAVRGDDTALASKFNMRLTARCTLVDARTGRVYFRNRSTDTDIDAFFDFGLGLDEEEPPTLQGLQSEFQSMPILTEKLSREISNMVLHTW